VSAHAIQLLVGLANPGPEYAKTRHNAGAWLIEAWTAAKGLSLELKPKFHGLYAKTTETTGDLHVLIPQTFMNLSGKAVAAIACFYKIPPEAILVIHDELDLAPGKLRLKQGGGHAGHNGLKDIERAIGSREFWRLRLGIGHPGVRELVTPYVLGKPSPDELPKYEDAITQALRLMPELLAGDMAKVTTQLR
jgi:PTH1 family peptidyl-tRNA hydrolase